MLTKYTCNSWLMQRSSLAAALDLASSLLSTRVRSTIQVHVAAADCIEVSVPSLQYVIRVRLRVVNGKLVCLLSQIVVNKRNCLSYIPFHDTNANLRSTCSHHTNMCVGWRPSIEHVAFSYRYRSVIGALIGILLSNSSTK